MVFIYIYTLSKQQRHFLLRESKAHIAMDIYTFIKETLMKEHVQAVLNLQIHLTGYLSHLYICVWSLDFNPLPASNVFCSLSVANSLDLDQARQNIGPGLDLN